MENHRNKLRRLRILQLLDQVQPSPVGERGLLHHLAADPELEPTIDLVRQSLAYLWEQGLVELVSIENVEWTAAYITDAGMDWITDPNDQGLEIYSPGYAPEIPDSNYGRVSSIELLPIETRTWLDQRLIGRNFTGYSELVELLEQQGLAISRSALGRYGKRLKARVTRYKEKAEVIRSLSDVFEDDAPAIMQGAMGSALTAVMDAIEDGKYGTGKETLSSLVKTLPGIGRGFRDAERHKIERETRKKTIDEAANVVEETARAQGLDDEWATALREKFLKGM